MKTSGRVRVWQQGSRTQNPGCKNGQTERPWGKGREGEGGENWKAAEGNALQQRVRQREKAVERREGGD